MADPIHLWPEGEAKNSKVEARIEPFILENPPDAGTVLVCPGGGYGHLAPHEGPVIAKALNERGLNGVVLYYRLAPDSKHPDMVHDLQRGMRLTRDHLNIWGVKNKKVAILGFSAGGHLASCGAVHYDRFTSEKDDLAKAHTARPDAAVLCYPVIDMSGEYTHGGSKRNLLGDKPDAELVELMTTYKQVTPETPPTFLWHTANDGAVPMQNAQLFAGACRKHGVPVESHIFEDGRHGLGLAADHPTVSTWFALCTAFLKRHLQ